MTQEETKNITPCTLHRTYIMTLVKQTYHGKILIATIDLLHLEVSLSNVCCLQGAWMVKYPGVQVAPVKITATVRERVSGRKQVTFLSQKQVCNDNNVVIIVFLNSKKKKTLHHEDISSRKKKNIQIQITLFNFTA